MVLSLLVVLSAIFATITPMWTDLDLQSIDNVMGNASIPMIADLKSKRIRKGLYGASGTITFNDDMSKYTANAELYYSAKGNGVWIKTPFTIRPGNFCDKLNHEYRSYVMKPMATASDMPVSDTGDMCNIIEQKTYTVYNYEIEDKKIPKYLQSGAYKFIVLLRKTAFPYEVTTEFHTIIKLS